jgi:hypothetical protein
MRVSDVYLIISQIYFVGYGLLNGSKTPLIIASFSWFILHCIRSIAELTAPPVTETTPTQE